MSPVISEQLALRLGLADKALPGMRLDTLIDALVSELAEPLTEKRLRSLSPKQFRALVEKTGAETEAAQLTQAYLILTGDEVREMQAPVVTNDRALSQPFLRVAVTSNNDEEIDGHFGSCLRVLIYEVNQEGWRLADVRPVTGTAKGEKRTDLMLELIKGCQLLVTQSIGGPSAARVVRANCHPIKQAGAVLAADVLSRLQTTLAGSPPPWISKILRAQGVEAPQAC